MVASQDRRGTQMPSQSLIDGHRRLEWSLPEIKLIVESRQGLVDALKIDQGPIELGPARTQLGPDRAQLTLTRRKNLTNALHEQSS